MIARKKAEDRFPVTVYLTRDERDALQKIATEEDRSLSNVLRQLLRERTTKGVRHG